MSLDYETIIGIITLLLLSSIMIVVCVLEKTHDRDEIFIDYGRPVDVDCIQRETMLQLIMVTKRTDDRGIDRDSIYVAVENKFAYVTVPYQFDLKYGKIYDCILYEKDTGEIVSLEIKGDVL